jgi:hypothetical protein
LLFKEARQMSISAVGSHHSSGCTAIPRSSIIRHYHAIRSIMMKEEEGDAKAAFKIKEEGKRQHQWLTDIR